MMENVEINKSTNDTLEFILNVSDLSTDNRTMSKSDVIAIAVEMYRLACMSPLMTAPAVDVWSIASNNHKNSK